jgi:endo-1,4-beta-xylanase
MIKKIAIITALILVFCFVACKGAETDNQESENITVDETTGGNQNSGGQDIAVTFQSLTADGSASVQTTTLTLKFDKDITDLAATDITFDAGTTGAVKGDLAKTATGTYTLGISGVTATGSVSVSVSKEGFTITGNPQTATVYPNPSTPPTPEAVTFQTLTPNGSASAQTTTLTLKFDKDIANLAATDITFDAGSTGAVKGTLTKGSTTGTYTLGISGVTATGSVSVSVSKEGFTITGNPKTATVYRLPDFVTVTTWSGLTVPSGTSATQYNIAQHGKTNVLKVSPKSTKYGYSVLEYNMDAHKGKEVEITISFDIWLETDGKVAWQLGQDGYPVVCGSTSTVLQTGQWHTVTNTVTVTPNGTLYLSSQQLGDIVVAYLANFVITVDGVIITPPGPPPDPNTLLYNKWPFPVGAAVASSAFNTSTNAKQYALLKHFNVVVAENEMKPGSVMPYNKPSTFPGTYRWTEADKYVNYGKANNTKVRGHVLVWHSQTPDWFFDVTTTGGVKTTTMQKEELYDRMEKHIKTVFEHFKGDVGWWDVCNEVVGDDCKPRKAGDPANGGSWYTQVMQNSGYTGDTNINRYEYVLKAFQFARKYADENNGQNVKLYLTDYNTEHQPGWGKLAEFLRLVDYLINNEAPIDGVGFQTHIDFDFDPSNISRAIDLVYAKTRKDGTHLMSQVTELDMGLYKSDTEPELSGAELSAKLTKQATLYRQLFDIFKQKYDAGKLDMVLLWGTDDGHSWRSTSNGRKDHPLLFDREYQQKAAYLELVR